MYSKIFGRNNSTVDLHKAVYELDVAKVTKLLKQENADIFRFDSNFEGFGFPLGQLLKLAIERKGKFNDKDSNSIKAIKELFIEKFKELFGADVAESLKKYDASGMLKNDVLEAKPIEFTRSLLGSIIFGNSAAVHALPKGKEYDTLGTFLTIRNTLDAVRDEKDPKKFVKALEQVNKILKDNPGNKILAKASTSWHEGNAKTVNESGSCMSRLWTQRTKVTSAKQIG